MKDELIQIIQDHQPACMLTDHEFLVRLSTNPSIVEISLAIDDLVAEGKLTMTQEKRHRRLKLK